MKRTVINRKEMIGATLDFGGQPMQLADYATTGFVGMAVSPRGYGKSNAGLLIAEQLSRQGWVSVLIDPESELEALYGEAVASPEALSDALYARSQPILVVNAQTAEDFIPYGRAILDAADSERKPIFVLIDEGQLFSTSKKGKNATHEASEIINEFVGRGRKRALDLFITALRFTGTLNRLVFANKNFTLIGAQEDPTVWSALAPQLQGTQFEFHDLAALMPGEFICFSRRGVEKLKMPMAEALTNVAPKTRAVQRLLPATFPQWSKAMEAIPDDRLAALTDPVIELLGSVAGLSGQQMSTGLSALADERATRA